MHEKQRNGLLVTDGGGIRGVLTTMALHSGKREVVKSGCHTLAILSDIQGQGARIAGADGVKVPWGVLGVGNTKLTWFLGQRMLPCSMTLACEQQQEA